jgi:phosphoribosylformylglycinamidine synthase
VAANALIIAGYGINCEDETAFAFRYNNALADIVHINDIIEAPEMLKKYQILAFPGGFSYGDDTGSGKAMANKIRNTLLEPLARFVERDTLTIGICNGCQVLANLGLVPGLDLYASGIQVGVIYNASYRYQCRWVDVGISDASSPWLRGIEALHIPVAHGEGNMVIPSQTLEFLRDKNMAPLYYARPLNSPFRGEYKSRPGQSYAAIGEGDPKIDYNERLQNPHLFDAAQSARHLTDSPLNSPFRGELPKANGEFPYNPNGSTDDIAGLTGYQGRVLALMPHPERGMLFTQRDDWPLQKELYTRLGRQVPVESDGMAIFHNAVKYFS